MALKHWKKVTNDKYSMNKIIDTWRNRIGRYGNNIEELRVIQYPGRYVLHRFIYGPTQYKNEHKSGTLYVLSSSTNKSDVVKFAKKFMREN